MKTSLSILLIAFVLVVAVSCQKVNHDNMSTKQHQSSASGLSS